MKTSLLIFLCVWSLAAAASAQTDVLIVMRLHANFYVALDHLPLDITPETLSRLYVYLEDRVETHADAPLGEATDHYPVMLRIVSPDAVGNFPANAEGFGGMVGLARWLCDPIDEIAEGAFTRCAIGPAEGSENWATVVIAVITETEDRNENLGLIAHELTHVFGSVDHSRSPGHSDYDPRAVREADPGDAYWWYGVTGTFLLQPVGIVWDALTGQCGASQATEWCMDLRQILVSAP